MTENINVSSETKKRLDAHKSDPKESYDDVVKRLLDNLGY